MDHGRSRLSSQGWLQGSCARGASVGILAASMVLLSACNAITGVGDLRLKDVDEEEDEGSSGGQVLSGGGPTSGGTGVGSSVASSSSGGMTACTYPEGVYGKQLGDIVSPSLVWDGYLEDATDVSQVSEISIKDYFDCDGSKKINALLVLESATWCPVCEGEAKDAYSQMTTPNGWADKGIRVLTLMVQNLSGQAATTDTAYDWKQELQPTGIAVAADPGMSLAIPDQMGGVGLPYIVVIDPRTMEVVLSQSGSSGNHNELEALAAKNAAGP